MTLSIDDIVRDFQNFCAGITDPEELRWVRLFMQIDDALRQITAAPMVKNDTVAVEILGNFAHCVTMEDLARQIDLLAYHIAQKTGSNPKSIHKTDAYARAGQAEDKNQPMIFKL